MYVCVSENELDFREVGDLSILAMNVHAHPPQFSGDIKVFIVDDDPAVGRLIAAILIDAGFQCVVFTSAQEFLDALDMNATGCLLLDIRMPDMTGPELQTVLAERGWLLPIIFLSASADVPTAVSVLQRGAVDLIEKPCVNETLISAVKHAISLNISDRARRTELNELQRSKTDLTPRECEVADHLADGKSNRQTALALGVSERTVEVHRARIMSKMGCDSIVNLGIKWMKLRASSKPTGGQFEVRSKPHAPSH